MPIPITLISILLNLFQIIPITVLDKYKINQQIFHKES